MRHRTTRAVTALSGVIAFTAMSMVIPSGSPASQAHADTGSAVTVTKNIIVDGISKTQPMTLTVSQTTNLAPRQTVSLSWTGAIPSHNYQVGLPPGLASATEYPVVLMQCWGSDTAGQLDPSHCETSGFYGLNRYSQKVYDETNILNPPNSTNVFVSSRGAAYPGYLKFQAVDGTWYDMSNNADSTVPAELQYGGIPLNARGEWSDANGSRSNVPFEMRSFTDYPASGCSDTQACTLVAVPITDPACIPGLPSTDPDCHHGPYLPLGPGLVTDYLAANEFLLDTAWWMQTDWRNRISVPMSFVKQNACSVTDQRQAVQLPGSQVASTVMSYYWDPAFCLDPTRFKLQYIQEPEPAARQALITQGPGGYGANAILTTLPVTGSPRPVVHAPVLATGFAISFLIDNGNNAQVTQLHLTPLLLAKLITQSYEAHSGEPALQGNPVNIFKDPEFLAVNPGFTLPIGAASDRALGTNLILPYPTQTDTIWALTSYINSDPEARAWLDGQPDAYSGMVVNPAFRNYALPQLAAALRDTWPDPINYVHPPTTPTGSDGGTDWACSKTSIPPFFNLASNGVSGLDNAATAVLNLQNPAQDYCDSAADASYGQFQKQASTYVGARALIALTSTAQAAEYLLPTAQLQVHDVNGNRLWAGPTSTSMSAALGYTMEDPATGVLSLDFPHLGPAAYPGTMPVYAAIPTAGLNQSDAKDYSQFLTFAATDGQTPGVNAGNLPPGYAPLPAALTAYTLEAAAHVAAQDGVVPAPPPDLPGTIRQQEQLPPPFNGSGVGNGSGGSPSTGSSPSSGAPGGSNPGHGKSPQVTTVAETRGSDSWLAAWGLPLLLGVGLLSGLGVPFVRVAAQPGHPARVFIGTNVGRLARRLRRRSA